MRTTHNAPPPLTAGRYILGLGTNLGSRLANLQVARWLLEQDDELRVVVSSRVYLTAPLGPPQDDFLNAALLITTSCPPAKLLEKALHTERCLGRTRDVRWGPRTMDLDILEGPVRLRSQTLTVPHPELKNRPFALAPLHDIEPEQAMAHGFQREQSPPTLAATLEVPTLGRGMQVVSGGPGTVVLRGAGPTAADAFAHALQSLSSDDGGTSEATFSSPTLADGVAQLLRRMNGGLRFRCLAIHPALSGEPNRPTWLFRLFGTGHHPATPQDVVLEDVDLVESSGQSSLSLRLSRP